ncbi:hypothetical protein JKF63_02714 [Porcisia hertigi]|uniref:Uncharacterized protein n=1 Tax=Porcisia hertigi TaxID=2761500 RepID=A0A836I1F8_9TRYP|nr:hypothetical protein JKF63_02714 [Porcisia hertigi]
MYSLSRRVLHTPSIRFTYALVKGGGIAAAPKAPTAGAATITHVQTIFESFDELPKHLRPRVFCDAEMDVIQMGGAAPYVPKHLQKKKK